jgi:hypothetical protein
MPEEALLLEDVMPIGMVLMNVAPIRRRSEKF